MAIKRAIPQVPKVREPQRVQFDESVKETLEIITGRRGGKLDTLPSDASLADVIAKINELLNRIQ